MYTLEQLGAFVAVYDAGSYSGAARALGKDRTTIREQVVTLEDALDLSLFEISGRKATPTAEASELISRARIIVRQNEYFAIYGDALRRKEESEITCAYDTRIPIAWLIDIETRALTLFPQTRINWLVRSRGDALDGLVTGEIDLVLMMARDQHMPEKEVAYRMLGNMPYGLYVGANSPLNRKERISIDECQAELQYLSEDSYQTNRDLLLASPNYRVVGSDQLAAEFTVNQGWSALPCHIAQPFVEAGLLFPFETDISTRSMLIRCTTFFRNGDQSREVIKRLIEQVEQVTREILI